MIRPANTSNSYADKLGATAESAEFTIRLLLGIQSNNTTVSVKNGKKKKKKHSSLHTKQVQKYRELYCRCPLLKLLY